MSRNGQVGQGRRRNPAEQDPYAQQDPYAPQDPYAAQWPQQPAAYPDPNYITGGQQGGFQYPAEPEPYGQGQMPGFDRFAPQQNGAQQWGGQQDPRGYDLGSYMPNGAQGYMQQQEPMQYAPPQQQGYAETEPEYDDGLEDGDDDPRGGRRWMVIVVALVGAIGLGGGLAYTYKMFFTNGSGRAALVKNAEPPNKVKISAARENPLVDKKLFTRLGEDGSASGSEGEAQTDSLSSDTQAGAARPVRVIPIQPGSQGQGSGQVTTTGSTDSGSRGSASMVAVPGLMIDAGGGQRGRLPQQAAQQQGLGAQQQVPQQRAAPEQGAQQGSPARIAGLPQQQQQQQQPTQRVATEPELPPRRPVTIPTTPTTSTTQQGASVNTSASTGGGAVQNVPKAPVVQRKEALAVGGPVSNGYVAVLSSKKTRMDAMKAYASMDQKYRDMLASSTFDVQEADLGDKGVWYRAVIGPPRSYEGAKKICEDLKAAGHPDCWPARY